MALLTLTTDQRGFAQSAVSDAWQKNIPGKAAALKEEGKLLIERHDYQGAITRLKQSLAFKQDYYLAVYNLALAYALRGTDVQAPSELDRKRAWRELDRAQAIAKAQGIRDATLYTTMGWLASMEAIFSQPEEFSLRTEWYNNAKRYLEDALNIDATSSGALNNLGMLYELQGASEHALQYYAKAEALQDAQGRANHRRLQRLTQNSFSAFAEKRFALLIGNKDYEPQVGTLKNPHKDIALIDQALQQVGFSVVSRKDLGRAEIMKQIDEFAERLSNAGPGAVGFFYYVGHGVSRPRDHVNYLIPIDIQNMQDPNFWWNAIALDAILDELKRGAPNASYFVVFDACRNELRLPARSAVKGFEPMTDKNDIFIALSTSPNSSASDVGEDSSPYARALASELTRPGQDHLTLFQNVKERVFSATNNTQRPWESNGLLKRVYFAGKTAHLTMLPNPTNVPQSPHTPSADELCSKVKNVKIISIPGREYPLAIKAEKKLREKGCKIEGPYPRSDQKENPDTHQIRYYHKSDEGDAELATRYLKEELKDELEFDMASTYISGYTSEQRPIGYLEIWLKGPLGTKLPPALGRAPCESQITAPSDGGNVGSQGKVHGKARIPTGSYLWVLAHLKSPQEDKWWPLGGGAASIDQDGTWVVEVSYGMARDIGKDFEIALAVVSEHVNTSLQQWVQRTEQTNQYLPIAFPNVIDGCPPVTIAVKKKSHE